MSIDENKIEGNKQRLIKWCKAYIVSDKNKEGLERFLDFLEKSDFYTAPASTRFHSNMDGGLCEHTLKVISRMFKVCNAELPPEETKTAEFKEKAFIVALCHDLCKVDFYKKSERNKKDENGNWYSYPYWEIEDQLPMGHGEKSLYIAQKYFDLSDEMAIAIRWHMGFSDAAYKGGSYDIGSAFSSYPFALYLSIADTMASLLDEEVTKY